VQGGVLTTEKPNVLHHCDNRVCVRGDHLFPGTPYDNNFDARTKGRARWANGETHVRAKLTAENVREIKKLLAEGRTQAQLAVLFGVTPANIWKIASGNGWRSLG